MIALILIIIFQADLVTREEKKIDFGVSCLLDTSPKKAYSSFLPALIEKLRDIDNT